MNNQTIEELYNRNLDSCYFSIICLPTTVFFKEGDVNINAKTVYSFYGCNLQGVRKFITSVISDKFSKTSEWYDFFLKFKDRKLEKVLYANIPNNKCMKDALRLAFPEVQSFISCFEPINKFLKYYTYSYTTNVFTLIRNIYLSENLSDYQSALSLFNDEYGTNTFLIELLEDDFKLAKVYYSTSYILRKHIYSFYFCRDTMKRMTTASHSKQFFTDINEFVELLLGIIQSSEKRMYCSKADWIELINFIYTDKKELIKCYL